MRILVCAALLAACNPNDPHPTSAAFYTGPSWTAQVNPDATTVLLGFDGAQPTMLVNASDTPDADGTTSLSVTSSAGTTIAQGDVGTAFESDALYAFAFAAATTPNVLVPARQCPGIVIDANLVTIKAASDWTPTDATISTFTWDPTSGVATEPASYDVRGASVGGLVSLGAGTCATGVATLDTSAQLYVSEGAALLHTAPQVEGADALALAIPRPDGAIAPSSLSGAYGGLFYDGGTSRVVTATLDGGTAAITSDGTTVAQLALTTAAVQDGQLLGTLTIGADIGPVVCATSTSPALLACATETADGKLASLALSTQ